MKKQNRQGKNVHKQLPKHVSKNKKSVKVDGKQVFWPGYGFGGFGGYGYPGFGFGVPYAGIGVGAGIGIGVGLGLGLGGFGYIGGWL